MRRTSWPTTPRMPTTSSTSFPSVGRNSKAFTTGRTSPKTPVAAPGVFGEEARVFGCRDERALHSIRGRNVGGRRPHDARRDGGRVPRGRSGRREAGSVALASRDRSTEGRGVSVGEQGWDARAGAPHLRRFAEAL